MLKRSFCHELANALASPLGSNYKMFDLTEYKANLLDTGSSNHELTMRLYHVVNATLNDINTSSL